MVCFYCLMGLTEENGTAARDRDGHHVCFACCAWLDVIRMMKGESDALYFDANRGTVTNWPGTLALHVTGKRVGRHNMAGKRTTVYFNGPCGTSWSGVQYEGPCSGNLLRQVRRLGGAS